MEGAIRHMPPSKRLKLRHQKEKEGKHLPQNPIPSKCLPAKKRIELQLPAFEILLPAKKRVWVPHPFRPLDDDSIEISGEGVADEEDDGVICAVCRSTDGDPVDPIVFCDGCDLMVHASCYGSPLIQAIPEGDWFCLRCEREGKDEGVDFDCCLCPVKGGAVKPTTDGGQWAHVLCALLVPEVFFRHPEGRDGIDCSCVPKERKEMKCYLCRSNHGCGIQCSQPNCELGFHVSCGLGEGLCIEYNEAKGGGIVAGFCKDHTLLWQKQAQTGKFKIVRRKKHLGKKKSKE